MKTDETTNACGPNFGLPFEYTPHNPDKLTPEQVGAGFRLLADVEIYKRGYGRFFPAIHRWEKTKWDSTSWKGSEIGYTYRVPADWPLDPDPAKAQPAKAWRLPDPPPGMAWHRTDWTEEMLPEGWRPFLRGENSETGDQVWEFGIGPWKQAFVEKAHEDYARLRTRRPLPLPPEAASPAEAQTSRPAQAKASDRQEGGRHYKGLAIQPAEFISRNGLNFLEGCVIKRVCRHRQKAGAEDIRKAIHELQLILEYEYPGQ